MTLQRHIIYWSGWHIVVLMFAVLRSGVVVFALAAASRLPAEQAQRNLQLAREAAADQPAQAILDEKVP